MQVTQIFFDWIEADGRRWAAVIGHSAGSRTFHCLRGAGKREAAGTAEESRAGCVDAARNAVLSDGMAAGPAVFSPEAVMYAQDAD